MFGRSGSEASPPLGGSEAELLSIPMRATATSAAVFGWSGLDVNTHTGYMYRRAIRRVSSCPTTPMNLPVKVPAAATRRPLRRPARGVAAVAKRSVPAPVCCRSGPTSSRVSMPTINAGAAAAGAKAASQRDRYRRGTGWPAPGGLARPDGHRERRRSGPGLRARAWSAARHTWQAIR